MSNPSYATWFRLSAAGSNSGVRCDESGVFIGVVPLLFRAADDRDREIWQVRSIAELNAALSESYGLPVDVSAKASGLTAIARALNSRAVVLAQITALHLHMPDPPHLAKDRGSREKSIALATLLYQSGILDTKWVSPRLVEGLVKRDVSNQPRVPRGQVGGGQWTTEDNAQNSEAPIIPAQAVPVPLPWGPLVRPGIRPLPPGVIRPTPPEIAPPLDIPGGVPREGIPQNPYPDRPECAEDMGGGISVLQAA